MLPVPAAMKHVRLMLMHDDARAAANALGDMEVLHLQPVEHCDKVLDEFPAREFSELYHRLRSRYRKIMDLHGEHRETDTDITLRQAVLPTDDAGRKTQVLDMRQLFDLDEELKQLWLKVSALEERMRQTRDRRNGVSQLQNSLQRFLALDVDLSRVGHSSRFLKVVSGSVANADLQRLSDALSLMGYLMESFYRGDSLDYVLIIGPAELSADAEELLKSADFRELSIPGEFSDRPSQVRRELNGQARELDRQLDACGDELDKLISAHVGLLGQVYALLRDAMAYASLAPYLKGKGQLVFLQGWAPASREQEITDRLQRTLAHPFMLFFDEPARDDYAEVPTSLNAGPLLGPFQVLVRQYGLPQYGEVDPGLLFAFSYTLMFGMMFGDIGHGAVIAIAAAMLYRRSAVIAVIGSLAGLSSMFFGFVYGSLFGYEHIVHPLWMSPMHDPQRMLTLALYWGMGFLVIANVLAIRNRLVRAEWHPALMGPLGVAGLLIYLSAAYVLIVSLDGDGEPGAWPLVVIALLMLVILYHQWRESSGSLGERILVVMIEGLEFVISNVSATLSFLRVAAFTLNHIALASAVFAIAAMLGSFGHWVAVLLGNVFIIVLEGAIVAIQCLRLEYYEGFSRFFSGKGRPYVPLKIDYP